MDQSGSEGRDDLEKSNVPPPAEKSFLGELWEFIRLPVLFAGIAFGISWAIWYGTTEPCTEALAEKNNCSLSTLARYVNLDALTKMFANAAIAGGAGTVWSYIMFTRERREREALQRRLNDVEREAAERRRQADERLRQADEERSRQASEERREREALQRRLDEMQRQADEERRQADEERRQASEERRQASEERRQANETIQRLTEQIVRLTESGNGNHSSSG